MWKRGGGGVPCALPSVRIINVCHQACCNHVYTWVLWTPWFTDRTIFRVLLPPPFFLKLNTFFFWFWDGPPGLAYGR